MNNNKLEKYNDAFIPTYKLSVYMNSLFRNIRENNDLDFIEESDDEDFENVSLDKYVNLNKEYKMKCVYNNKYKLWTPLNISEEPIVNKKIYKHNIYMSVNCKSTYGRIQIRK